MKIEPENQTMASITFQNYFRMYPKLSGMTGTAATEAAEFWDIYKLNVVEIPTNVAVPADRRGRRVLQEHRTTSSRRSPKAIGEKSKIGQPVLVGTVSIEKSELLSEFLDKEGVKHAVLNARFHEMASPESALENGVDVVRIALVDVWMVLGAEDGGTSANDPGAAVVVMEDGPGS